VVAGTDRSVQIHVTHGARRQVEVVRDAILHVLAADPTLEPRDIVIMTPDLATFAPLLEAAFPANGVDENGLPDLRLRIADRSPAAVNPLVRFAATVLDLAASRLEAGRLRELVTKPVVQQRFGFDLDTAGEIIGVIDDARVSWGMDAADRAAWRAGTNDERTWRRGLDRALAGVFYEDDPVHVVAGTAPLDGVEGQDATPVGLLAAIVDRVVAIRDMLATPLPASQWGRAISDSVRLLAKPGWDDEWQLGQLERLLAETFPDPAEGAPDPVLSLAEARRAVAGWTEARPSPLHFRTGDVTVCTLVPMRSVPYRVVCLLGMDDDRFPRSSRIDGDDLLLGDEIVGDFDRASQDRQLLLDAVMAAGEHLIVTYSGRDELTNGDLPPAVPIAELRDALEAMVGEDGLEAIETIHPLQSFSEANFTPGELDVPGSFGFDPAALAGAKAVAPAGPRAVSGQGAPAGHDPPWPEPDPIEAIALEDLIRFLQHPVQRFMAARMGFSVPKAGEIPDDTLPADLDALSQWGLKERLLDGLADGYELEELSAREIAGDGLPPGVLGHDDLAAAVEAAAELWSGAVERGYNREAMRPYRGTVQIGEMTLEGTVLADPERVHIARVTASRVKGKHRLRAFTELVFLSVLEPDVAWESFILGRYAGGRGHVAVTVGPIGDSAQERRQESAAMLTELVALFVEGHAAPLPMPCESTYNWQRYVRGDRGKAWGVARDSWERDRFNPEAEDPAHRLLLGDLGKFKALHGAGFADYAERLWGPIIPLTREKKL
jgi:exodeoxyribonuclease V gamma subunit